MNEPRYAEEPYIEEFFRCANCGGVIRDHKVTNRHSPRKAPYLEGANGCRIPLPAFRLVKTQRVRKLRLCDDCSQPIRGREYWGHEKDTGAMLALCETCYGNARRVGRLA